MNKSTASAEQLQAEDIWKATVSRINEHNSKLKLYVNNSFFLGNSSGQLRVAVANKFILTRFNREIQSIQDIISEFSNGALQVQFEVDEEFCESQRERIEKKDPIEKKETNQYIPFKNSFYNPLLDDAYTFESFVQSDENKIALELAKIFAGNESPINRVLYIFGNYGLGKTHLSQACVREARRNGLGAQWVSGEKLKELWSRTYKENRFDDFNKAFLRKKLLVVDNVQALEGGKGTQKKLLEIMKLYSQEGGKVLLTSYLTPEEMRAHKKINENLSNLFVGGLNAKMESPSLEARIEILKTKATHFGVDEVPENVLKYMATRLDGEIRQLEAGIANLVSYSKVLNQPIDLGLAQNVLSQLVGEKNRLDEDYLTRLVCNAYGISEKELKSKSRRSKISHPRQVAFFLFRNYLDLPLSEIGKYFKRSHGTVIHGINEIEERRKSDPKLEKELNYIQKRIYSPLREKEKTHYLPNSKKPIQMLIGEPKEEMKF